MKYEDPTADGVMLLIEHCEESAEMPGRGETLTHLYDMHLLRDSKLFEDLQYSFNPFDECVRDVPEAECPGCSTSMRFREMQTCLNR